MIVLFETSSKLWAAGNNHRQPSRMCSIFQPMNCFLSFSGKNLAVTLLVASSFCILCTGCKNSGPTPLINGVNSRQNPEQVKRIFGSKRKWRVTDGSRNFLVLSTSSYSHLGVKGKLEISFFQDQLMATTFYPTDFTKYKNLLGQHLKINFNKTSGTIVGGTRIFLGGHPASGRFVQWADIELSDEWDYLIECCA